MRPLDVYNSNMRSILSVKFTVIFIELIVVACIFLTKVHLIHPVRKYRKQCLLSLLLHLFGGIHQRICRSVSGDDCFAADVLTGGCAV
jgi:hypothetical protein